MEQKPTTALVQQVEEVLLAWVYPQRSALAELVQSGHLDDASVGQMLERLTEAASHTLGVDRTSVWRLRADGSAIDCLDLFERPKALHSTGLSIAAAQAPAYFQALASGKVIAASDARRDPRTAEFDAGYLAPTGIASMLDAPVFMGGKACGVVCHEQIGSQRQWQFWEELVASTFADFVALVLEAQSRAKEVAERAAYESRLVREVNERTLALSESEQNLQALLDSAPVALVLTRASDHRVIYTNARARTLFEIGDDGGIESLAANFWVDDADRQAFVGALLAKGRVDDLEVRLSTKSKRVFWARMAAQAMRFRGELALLGGIVDISEQRQAQAALRKSEQTLRSLLDAAPTPLLVTGLDDAVVRFCNLPAQKMFELRVEQFVGRRAPDFYVNAEDRKEFIAALRSKGEVDGFSARLQTSTGRAFWALINAKTLELNGENVFMMGFADVSAHKDVELRLRTLAATDGLTNTYNRRHFFDLGEVELQHSAAQGQPTSLAMLDIDHFKTVNDDHGHAAGDEALRALAAVLRQAVRKSDVIARIGGEEFALLFPGTALADAERTLERMRGAISARPLTDGLPRPLTVSIGAVEHRAPESLGDLLKRADECLYEAKESGRDRLVVRR